jgi:hypothetical protein
MANPIPCGACGEVPDCDFLVTNRAGTEWFGLAPSVGLCVSCLIAVAHMIEDTLAATVAEHPAGEPASPGVLEAVEAEAGPQAITAQGAGRRSRKSAPAEGNGHEAVPETETADVDR